MLEQSKDFIDKKINEKETNIHAVISGYTEDIAAPTYTDDLASERILEIVSTEDRAEADTGEPDPVDTHAREDNEDRFTGEIGPDDRSQDKVEEKMQVRCLIFVTFEISPVFLSELQSSMVAQ